jgi:hypothetical protein
LYSIVRAIIVGFLQTTSDYLLKPTFAVLFNGFLQPQFVFARNIFQSICDMIEPISTATINFLERFIRPFAECVGAFRLVEVKNLHKVIQPTQNSQEQQQST